MHRALMRDNYPPLSRRVGDFHFFLLFQADLIRRSLRPLSRNLIPVVLFGGIFTAIIRMASLSVLGLYLFCLILPLSCNIFDLFSQIFPPKFAFSSIFFPFFLHIPKKCTTFVPFLLILERQSSDGRATVKRQSKLMCSLCLTENEPNFN